MTMTLQDHHHTKQLWKSTLSHKVIPKSSTWGTAKCNEIGICITPIRNTATQTTKAIVQSLCLKLCFFADDSKLSVVILLSTNWSDVTVLELSLLLLPLSDSISCVMSAELISSALSVMSMIALYKKKYRLLDYRL